MVLLSLDSILIFSHSRHSSSIVSIITGPVANLLELTLNVRNSYKVSFSVSSIERLS